MDASRFDRFTRALGVTVSRRRLLRAALGVSATAAGLAAVDDASAACASIRGACSAIAPCCDLLTCHPTRKRCVGNSGDRGCRTTVDCNSGLVCRRGVCTPKQVCRPYQASCATGSCCARFACDLASHTCLRAIDEVCETNAECANELVCREGACQVPGQRGYACDDDADCATGLGCNLVEHACRTANGAPCSAAADCGENGSCTDGVCVLPVTPCLSDSSYCRLFSDYPEYGCGTCVADPIAPCTAPVGRMCYTSVEGCVFTGYWGYETDEPCTTSADCSGSFHCGTGKNDGSGYTLLDSPMCVIMSGAQSVACW